MNAGQPTKIGTTNMSCKEPINKLRARSNKGSWVKRKPSRPAISAGIGRLKR